MPDNFEPYRFLKVLGSGGLGTVYQVEDTRMGRNAVMKVGTLDLDVTEEERFRTEARTLGQLHHPNIPALYDSGALSDGRPFLVTEWVDGSVLADLLSSRVPLSIRDVLLLARAVARALGHAHEHEILHLDVKPANILVPTRAGEGMAFEEAKLLDFSVLGRLEASTSLTRAGTVVGTPYYMSPEQVRGEALSPAADIFSLGVVMYEMLSGRLPFGAESVQEMFFALLSKEPEPLGSPIPPQVAELVRRCLSKDPNKRPRSGTAMTVLIDELLDTELPAATQLLDQVVEEAPVFQRAPTTGHGPGEFTRLFSQPPHGAAAERPAPAPLTPMPQRHSKVVIAVAVAVAVGIVAFAVLLVARIKPAGEWWLIALGSLLVVTGVGMGIAVRRVLARRRDELTGDISALLKGAKTKRALSMTLSLQVDEVIKKCRLMDEKFLGLTMALMVKEYGSARKFDDRQKALMNAIAILDKLGPKLSPWYVRHEKLIATGVSLVGIASGLATAAQSVVKLVKGTP